jgi:hypothetical protein
MVVGTRQDFRMQAKKKSNPAFGAWDRDRQVEMYDELVNGFPLKIFIVGTKNMIECTISFPLRRTLCWGGSVMRMLRNRQLRPLCSKTLVKRTTRIHLVQTARVASVVSVV